MAITKLLFFAIAFYSVMVASSFCWSCHLISTTRLLHPSIIAVPAAAWSILTPPTLPGQGCNGNERHHLRYGGQYGIEHGRQGGTRDREWGVVRNVQVDGRNGVQREAGAKAWYSVTTDRHFTLVTAVFWHVADATLSTVPSFTSFGMTFILDWGR